MSIYSSILHQSCSLTLRRFDIEDVSLLFEKMYSNPGFMRLMRLNDNIQAEAQLRERIAQRLQVSPAESGVLECMVIHKQYGAIGIAIATSNSKFKNLGGVSGDHGV